MDHKVSKDMISSGMIPSGEKTQADLGRTQYGSAPSPNSLMEAYRSIYEHHQKDADGKVIEHEEKEELNEGKMPEGLKNYLMKKDKKKDDKKEMKEDNLIEKGMTMATRKIGMQNRAKPTPQKPVTQMNDVDLFDLVKGALIDEGCSEQEAIKIMVNLSEEEKKGLLQKVGDFFNVKKKIDNKLNQMRNTSKIGGNKRVDDVRAGSGDSSVGQKINF